METSQMTPEEKRKLLELLKRKEQAQLMESAGTEAQKVEEFTAKAKDYGKATMSGLAQGVVGLTELGMVPARLGEWGVNKAAELAGAPEGTFGVAKAGGEALRDVRGAVSYKPEATGAKYALSVAESAPGAALGPGTKLLKGLSAFGSGIGAEMAGQAIGEDNALARAVGAMVGGVLPWTAMGKVQNAQQLVHESLQHTTPGDFKRAQRLADELAKNKIDSFLNSQLLGPRSTFDDLVQQASGFSHTRPPLIGRTEQASRQAGEAMGAWTDMNLPPQVASRRNMLGDIQERAANRIAAGKRLSNARYAQNMPQGLPDYDPGQMMQMHQELAALAASPKFRNSEGGRALERFVQEKLTTADGLPVTDPIGLNNIYKDLNALRLQEGWKGLPDTALKDVLKKYTPEFDAARAAKSKVMTDVVQPMQKGLTGDIARMGGGIKPDRYTALETAFNRVFTPDRNQAQEIEAFARQIGKDEFSQFFGEYLRKQVSKELNRASTVQGPYKLGLNLARTPEQMANLNASLKIVAESMGAKPSEVTKGFSNLLRAFDSYKDLNLASALNNADSGFRAGLNVTGLVIAPHSRVGRASFDIVARRTYQEIADLAMSPDGLKKLEQLARVKPTSSRMKAFIQGMVQTTMQGLSAEQPRKSPMLDDVMKGAQ